MTGVVVSQLQDGSFLMDQKAYVDNIHPAESKPERRKTPEAYVTEREKSTLRGLWGAIKWPCIQTDAKRACVVSMLHSSLAAATVGTLMKPNRILEEMKSDLGARQWLTLNKSNTSRDFNGRVSGISCESW